MGSCVRIILEEATPVCVDTLVGWLEGNDLKTSRGGGRGGGRGEGR